MTVHLPMVLYLLYGALMAFGFLLFLFLAMIPHWLRKKPQLLLFVMLLLACLITLFMDMYNTYFSYAPPERSGCFRILLPHRARESNRSLLR